MKGASEANMTNNIHEDKNNKDLNSSQNATRKNKNKNKIPFQKDLKKLTGTESEKVEILAKKINSFKFTNIEDAVRECKDVEVFEI